MSAPNPPLIPQPFAEDAGPLRNTIPDGPQPNNQLANFEQGFTPITMTPKVAGGKPMLGPDMNGILFAITAHLFAQQGGQLYVYDAATSTAIGGYKQGAVLAMDDGSGYWINLAVDNTTDPDAGGANWAPVYSYGFADVSGLVGGSRVLTTMEAAKGIILCTGALVANQQIVVPNRIAQWLVINATTGGFSLTVKTAAGTGVTIPQGGAAAPTNVWSDAVNVYNTVAPITIPTSVAPTPNTIPLRDNNGYLYGNYYNQSSGLENPTIDGVGVFSADGFLRKISMLNFELQMQLANINGQLQNSQVPYGVISQWAATLFTNAALTGVPTAPTAAPGTNTTQIATTAFVQSVFSLLANGYARFPNGVMLQWGFNTRFGSAAQTVSFNTPFTSTVFICLASPKQASGDALGQVPTVTGTPNVNNFQLAHSDGSQGAYWFAIESNYMSVPTPETIVRPFGNTALGPTDPGGMVLPIPVPSQIGIENGAASFTDGFPPLNMADPALGGVLPSGQDFNGLLYMITSYCAWLQGGGGFTYSADFVAENTGYGVGAILRSAVTPSKFFMNTVADNAADPDVDTTGWISYSPIAAPTGVQTAAPGAGPFTVALNVGVGFLDITPSAAATLTNITGATDGQIVTVTNLSGSFGLTVQKNANIRQAGDLGLLQDNSTTLRYSAALGKWTNLNG